MSVLKSKRSTSKAEYVNLANEIYTETVAFLALLTKSRTNSRGML